MPGDAKTLEAGGSLFTRKAVQRLAVAAFGLAASVSCWLILRSPADDQLADLHVYWGGTRWVEHGLALYDFHAENGDPFTYPPFAALVMAPLARLPFGAAGVMWTALSLLTIVGVGRLVAGRALHVAPSRRLTTSWLVAVGVLASAPGQSDIHFGQVSLFIVAAVLADGLGATGSRWHGALTGVAAAVKLTPLLFILYLAVTGQRRAAANATAGFMVATGLAWLVMPRDSTQFWTSAIFASDRVMDLTALGNQSVNGMLLRAGLAPGALTGVWVVLVGSLVIVALWRARQLTQAGQAERAVILMGCATVAASPVSWTHHQFWTVIAGVLLLGTTGQARRIAGALLLILMTINAGTIVAALGTPTPGAGYLADNLRALAACMLCTSALLAMSDLRLPLPASASVPHRWLRTRPRLVAVTLTTALIGFLVLPVPSRATLAVTPSSAAAAVAQVTAAWPTCYPTASCGTAGPLYPVNYSVDFTDRGITVSGLAAADVTRVEYLPAPGRPSIPIPLGRTPTGDQAFEFTTGDTTYGQLLVFGTHAQPLGEHGDKLRTG
ncbi:glycosyltransferase 87 family protein [Dermatophilaceae bacterium Soc4.6]